VTQLRLECYGRQREGKTPQLGNKPAANEDVSIEFAGEAIEILEGIEIVGLKTRALDHSSHAGAINDLKIR